ncbi:hypothetical protein pipiens_015361, partial [Culex pipiens pipiens]
MHCTSSTQQQMRSVQDVPNLFWRCDGCVVAMETPEYRTAFRALCEALRSVSETHTKAFEEVKAELVETNNKIDQLISKLPEPKTAPTWPSNKRRRSSSSSSSAKPEVPKASVGRKVMTTVPIVPTTNGDDNMMWMWLSSFPPTVTEDDIRAMVRECLSFDAEETIDVKMLVKKDADISKLRAVSFKIGVDVKHEDAAMDGDNWPAGVSFREFIFYDRKQTADVDNLGPEIADAQATQDPLPDILSQQDISSGLQAVAFQQVRFYYQNVRSLNNKVDEFFLACTDCEYDVILLTETWLDGSVKPLQLFGDLFAVYTTNRNPANSRRKVGGGVLIAVRKTLDSVVCVEAAADNLEQIFVTIHLKNQKMFIGCFYLPSEKRYEHQLVEQHLTCIETVRSISAPNDTIVVVGDYNQSHLVWKPLAGN